MGKPPKLEFRMWGIRVSAEGVVAICAALVLVLAALVSRHF